MAFTNFLFMLPWLTARTLSRSWISSFTSNLGRKVPVSVLLGVSLLTYRGVPSFDYPYVGSEVEGISLGVQVGSSP